MQIEFYNIIRKESMEISVSVLFVIGGGAVKRYRRRTAPRHT